MDGVSRIERFPVGDLRVGLGGEIKKVKRERRGDCRASQLLFAAADDLRARASLDAPPARVAVVLGTALGGVEEGEKALAGDPSARRAAAALYDGPARALALRLGARGPVITVSTACASGATALGVAADLLRSDAADLVVAGGDDILCRFVMRGFDALRSLTRGRVRPFDRRRSGLLLGEGAALVLLARDRDAGERRLGRLLRHAGGGDARGDHVPARVARGRRAAHGRARGARPGVRAGFRGDGAARGSPAGEPLHLARFRRVQCRARPRGGCAVTGTEVAAVGVVTGWGEGAAALPSDAVRAAAGRRGIAAAPPPFVRERVRPATREWLLGGAAGEALPREANIH